MKESKLTKSIQKTFKRKLKDAVVEKDVEDAYRYLITQSFDPNEEELHWTSPYSSDGLYSEKKETTLFNTGGNAVFFKNYAVLRLLLETKFKKSLLDDVVSCQTLLQAVYYIKRFEQNGEALPNVVLVGDENECFVVQGSELSKYLTEKIDWSIAPSSAGFDSSNSAIVLKMVNDEGISRFVFKVTENDVDLNDVISLIKTYAQGLPLIKLKITEKNIRETFEWFINCVFFGTFKNYEPDDLVSIFIQSLCSPRTCYLNPNNTRLLHLGGRELPIDANAYISFFARYEKNYSPKEKRQLTSIADRLIEETKRRFHGDFWTPTQWASKAHETLKEQLGKTYREDFVVWDSSCGAKNLTRDYYFKELYLSTLHQSELDLSKEYNPQAITFQMDFLNDDVNVSPNTPANELTNIPPPHCLRL